jgi:hypothetical protein
VWFVGNRLWVTDIHATSSAVKRAPPDRFIVEIEAANR